MKPQEIDPRDGENIGSGTETPTQPGDKGDGGSNNTGNNNNNNNNSGHGNNNNNGNSDESSGGGLNNGRPIPDVGVGTNNLENPNVKY